MDDYQLPVMRYIRILRDVHRKSFDIISDDLEAILAKREGRRPIPRSGVQSSQIHRWLGTSRKQRMPKQFRELIRKGNLHRPWSRQRCQAAYANIAKVEKLNSRINLKE